MSAGASTVGANLRAGQYLRVSLDKSGRARSLDDQQVENEHTAARRGWTIAATYRDPNVSASRYATKVRGAYGRLLADLRAGQLDVLILWEPSRGSRRVSEWVLLLELCEEKDVTIHVTSHHRDYHPARPRDRRTLLEDAVDSEYESGKTSERVQRAVNAAAAAGRPHGHVPYGYRRERDTRTGALTEQVPDECTASVIREITERLLDGDTLHGIALDLNNRRVPTPQAWRATQQKKRYDGEGWTSSKLRALFRNPTYAGVRAHREGRDASPENTRGMWPPLITELDYRSVVRLLADPARAVHHRGVAPRHLLSGLARCGTCQAWLRPQRNRGVPSYFCAGWGPGTPKAHVCRTQEPLDAYVEVAVITRLSRPDALQAFSPAPVSDGRLEVLARELADARAQLAESVTLTGQGRISPSSFALIEPQMSARIAELEQRLAPPVQLPAVVRDMVGPDAGLRWERLDMAGKRLVVRTLLEVTVLPVVQRGRCGFDPSLVRLEWRRR